MRACNAAVTHLRWGAGLAARLVELLRRRRRQALTGLALAAAAGLGAYLLGPVAGGVLSAGVFALLPAPRQPIDAA